MSGTQMTPMEQGYANSLHREYNLIKQSYIPSGAAQVVSRTDKASEPW